MSGPSEGGLAPEVRGTVSGRAHAVRALARAARAVRVDPDARQRARLYRHGRALPVLRQRAVVVVDARLANLRFDVALLARWNREALFALRCDVARWPAPIETGADPGRRG